MTAELKERKPVPDPVRRVIGEPPKAARADGHGPARPVAATPSPSRCLQLLLNLSQQVIGEELCREAVREIEELRRAQLRNDGRP